MKSPRILSPSPRAYEYAHPCFGSQQRGDLPFLLAVRRHFHGFAASCGSLLSRSSCLSPLPKAPQCARQAHRLWRCYHLSGWQSRKASPVLQQYHFSCARPIRRCFLYSRAKQPRVNRSRQLWPQSATGARAPCRPRCPFRACARICFLPRHTALQGCGEPRQAPILPFRNRRL